MDTGLTYAKTHQLRPGIALSAAQMAQLTADIVWLVEQSVTLADGSQQKVLVPQVYVRVQPGDLDGSGSLLAGKQVNIQLTGDLTNSGTIAGRSVVSLTAENVNNLAGRINGDAVSVAARSDLNNIGGSISATNQLVATAGRDLNVVTTTRSASSITGANSFSRTSIDRVAGLYVTGTGPANAGGLLVASAGRDINVVAGIIGNASAGGASFIAAGRDINLATVTTEASNTLVWDAKNRRSDSQSAEVGSQIVGAGSIDFKADQDIKARAANVHSGGTLAAVAGRDITIAAGQSSQAVDEAHQHTSKGVLSKTTITTRDTMERTDSIGSSFAGSTVLMQAGNNIHVIGSAVASEQGTALLAGNNLIVEAAQNTFAESHSKEQKKTGLMTSGSLLIRPSEV